LIFRGGQPYTKNGQKAMHASPLRFLIWCSVLAVVCGCGRQYAAGVGVKVSGKIVKGGQPLQVPTTPTGSGFIDVNLSPAEAADSGKLADTTVHAEPDGSFFLDYEGRGLPPGKYKVAVLVREVGGVGDELKGKFSQDNTPIRTELDKSKIGGTMDVGTIDLDTAVKK
jgi:hypothetical protein